MHLQFQMFAVMMTIYYTVKYSRKATSLTFEILMFTNLILFRHDLYRCISFLLHEGMSSFQDAAVLSSTVIPMYKGFYTGTEYKNKPVQ